MDQPEQNLNSTDDADVTEGVTSSLELGNVKKVLAIKLERPETHYTSLSPLGKGSFGEVHAVHDTLLGREVAVKSLKKQFREEEEVVDRFLKEARGTAQLEHPNIMPVHEIGVTDELGIYFTMKKIEGETLKDIFDRLEANTSFYIKQYPLIKLLEIFLAVCNGIAFAHSKGIIHRDLKPANIMIGEFGEVLILDWGLVKKLGEHEETGSNIQLRMDEFEGSNTIDGAISGTPNYMSPEQADGRIEDVGFQSDVYSLGAILYQLLTYLPPFERTQLRKLLENVKLGKFTPPRKRRPDLKIPRELEAICLKAMSRFQVNRYRSVERLAEDIRNYVGHHEVRAYKAPRHIRMWKACRRHPVRSSVIAAAVLVLLAVWGGQKAAAWGSFRDSVKNADLLLAGAGNAVAEAATVYDELSALQEKAELHEKSDKELELEKKLSAMIHDIDIRFNLALSYYTRVPTDYHRHERVQEGYREIYQQRIEFALYRKEYGFAQQWVDEVRELVKLAGREFNEEMQGYFSDVQRRINGIGSLEIISPGGVDEVIIWPFRQVGPRLALDDAIERGKEFPLTVEGLIKGSYMMMVTRSDGSMLAYPVYMNHAEKRVLELDLPASVPDGMVYVPSGDFIFGGSESRFYRRHTRNLPSFFIKQYEVTVSEYLEFWISLKEDALKDAFMSRVRFHANERRYQNAWDNQGRLLDQRLSLNYPVVGITQAAALAFCEWKSRQLGAVVRLPTVEEWEKAARGVDGRIYAWGNGFDPEANLALTKANKKGKTEYPYWAPPGKFSRDISVYNACDMAGNVREMTSTPLPDSSGFFQLKGGSASTPQNFLPCSNSSDTPVVPSDVGFRYMMEIRK